MEKKFNRRVLREKVLQILYAFDMNGEGLSSITEGILADLEEESDKDFCRILVNKTVMHKAELDGRINDCVNNWELNRIALIDKILLRMGLSELLYLPDIPPKVTINEIIEIAKNFSTPNSGKFINGILDTVLSQLKKAGTLNKTGRGLIDETIQKKPKRKITDEE
ncbi:MAG: transcription antitermination factor NusB [Ignavibacteriales bacterium]